MRIAVLGSARSWYFQDLLRAARAEHDLVAIPWTRLQADIRSQRQDVRMRGLDLHEFDAVLVRSMPPGSLEQVVFRMNALAVHERTGGLVVNAPRSLEVAVDKYLALSRLQEAGFAVPETITCQSRDDARAAVARLGDDIVMKPLFGGEGRGLVRFRAGQVDECMARLDHDQVFHLQRFVPHRGRDIRLLTIGDRVLGMQRVQPDDWRTNVSLGATCEPVELTDKLAELAQRAAAAVKASICALDLLPANDDHLYALEVNAVPGWRALAQTTNTDVAKLVLEHLSALQARR